MSQRAGKYEDRIAIQQAVYSTSASGQRQIVAWVDVCNPWAEREHQSGGESFGSDQRSQSQLVAFKIRYRRGIDPKMFVLYDGQRYDIKTVEEIERRETLRLVCEVFEAEV